MISCCVSIFPRSKTFEALHCSSVSADHKYVWEQFLTTRVWLEYKWSSLTWSWSVIFFFWKFRKFSRSSLDVWWSFCFITEITEGCYNESNHLFNVQEDQSPRESSLRTFRIYIPFSYSFFNFYLGNFRD